MIIYFDQIHDMPEIKADKIDGLITKIDINKSGIKDTGHQEKKLGDVYVIISHKNEPSFRTLCTTVSD